MFLEIIIVVLVGIVAGCISGIVPGIHINLVATLLFIYSSYFLGFTTPLVLACFIISMSIAHTFLDFLPSIFLGAPNDETALSVLPGHRMLLKGHGYEALKLSVIGCIFGLILAAALTYIFILIIPPIYPYLTKAMAFILIALSAFLIFKDEKKIFALIVFILAGFLGYATMNFMLLKQSLFPLFTGLFGTSLLSITFLQNVKIPEQQPSKLKIKKSQVLKTLGLSVISSSLVSFLPGVGSAQAATIASSLKKLEEKYFLLLLGAINSFVLLLSFVALYVIDKPRTGVAVFVGKFLPDLSSGQLWLLILIAIIVGFASFFIALALGKVFTRIIARINYKWLCFSVLLFLVILTPIISGWFGLLILLVSTALGVFCSLLGVKKIFLMGSLLLPVIFYYLL